MASGKRRFLMMSDSPSTSSGLSRVWREVTERIYADLSDYFEVASLGLGGNYSTRFPWPQYTIMRIQDMVVYDLPYVAQDFFGPERGIIAVCWNASWLKWLADPTAALPASPLRDYLCSGPGNTRPFDLWLYAPIDGHTPSGRLPVDTADALRGVDRLLAYTSYGAGVIDRALGNPSATTPHLPHGLDASNFYPRDRAVARQTFIARVSGNPDNTLPILPDMVMLAAIGTNSARKDWAIAFQTCAELVKRGYNIFFWGHTDAVSAPGKPWNLAQLAVEYGMQQRTVLTCSPISNDNLAWAYSAMDCTLSIGSGEGFGYTAFESLACGCPTIHSDYAGSAEFLLPQYKVAPVGYRIEQQSMIMRPLASPEAWACAVEAVLGQPAELPRELDWDGGLWKRWKQWLLSGLEASK